MEKILIVDCCVRGERSRTARLLRAFVQNLEPGRFTLRTIRPEDEHLQPLTGPLLRERDRLLAAGDRGNSRFDYANQFASADYVVLAAPFWDLSFPALFKIYVENISVEGITFVTSEKGLKGMCQGKALILLTTRGGYYEGTDMEQGTPYCRALAKFFGFDSFTCIAAEGMDFLPNPEPAIQAAEQQAKKLAQSL